MKYLDQLNRDIDLKKTPVRILSLVPSQTELLVDLGLEKSIVGITAFCVHPEHLLQTKTLVGGTKKVNIKKVQKLKPDIILCNKEENTAEMVEELEKVAPVHCSDISTIPDALELIKMYGEIFQCEKASNILIAQIQVKLEELNKLAELSKARKVAYLIWDNPLMVAGTGTFINEMLKLNKLENVFQTERYPETNIEELNKKEIDLCMLSSEPYSFESKHKKTFSKVAKSVILVDGEYFSWYGSRLLKALDYFKRFHL